MKSEDKTVGILGGMGPYATIDFFKKVVEATPAKKDWEHLRLLIDNNPKIPSRTRAVIYGEESPVPCMVESINNLKRAGANFVVIPCNTAHYFLKEVLEKIDIPVLNMIDESAKCISEKDVKNVGLLSNFVPHELFKKTFAKKGIRIVIPSKQEHVVDAIEEAKLGHNKSARKIILNVVSELLELDVQAVLIGCTELSILLKEGDLSVSVFDTSKILAEATVKKAKNVGRDCCVKKT